MAGGADYAGNPRPAVVIQDDAFGNIGSATICPFTSIDIDAPLLRVAVAPTEQNGLRALSYVMVDKVTTVFVRKLDEQIGLLSGDDLRQLNRALFVFLGLGSSVARSR